jgi:hypothetical protein
MHALTGFGFPMVAQYTSAASFGLFAGAMLVQAVMIWRYFPENGDGALETMERTVEAEDDRQANDGFDRW